MSLRKRQEVQELPWPRTRVRQPFYNHNTLPNVGQTRTFGSFLFPVADKQILSAATSEQPKRNPQNDYPQHLMAFGTSRHGVRYCINMQFGHDKILTNENRETEKNDAREIRPYNRFNPLTSSLQPFRCAGRAVRHSEKDSTGLPMELYRMTEKLVPTFGTGFSATEFVTENG